MAEAWSTGLKAAVLGQLAGSLVGGLPQFPTFVRLIRRLRGLVKKWGTCCWRMRSAACFSPGSNAEIVTRPTNTHSIHDEPMNPARLIRLVESWEVSRRERTPEERSFIQISRLP